MSGSTAAGAPAAASSSANDLAAWPDDFVSRPNSYFNNDFFRLALTYWTSGGRSQRRGRPPRLVDRPRLPLHARCELKWCAENAAVLEADEAPVVQAQWW